MDGPGPERFTRRAMKAAQAEQLRARLAEAPSELRRFAQVIGEANGSGPDEGLVADALDFAREVVRDADALDLAGEDVPDRERFEVRRAAEELIEGLDGEPEKVEAVATARYDPKTGARISPVDALNEEIRAQGGTAEIVRVKQVGAQDARWYLTIKSERTGKNQELRSMTTKQLRNLGNLAERVMEADGGEMPTPRAGSEKHGRLMKEFRFAREFEDHGATEDGTWRQRLASYVRRNEPARRDLSDPEHKRHAVCDPFPFEADDRLWVSSGHWLETISRGTKDATLADVQSALKRLGFASERLQARVDGHKDQQHYWVSPRGFDWRSGA
jgi:hypothetical protein